MTTAHRPTFDPARGKDLQKGPAYHQRLQPAHLTLKRRLPGQGNVEENRRRDLRAVLLHAEALHYGQSNVASAIDSGNEVISPTIPLKTIEYNIKDQNDSESMQTSIELSKSVIIDADKFESSDEEEEEEDDEDETAELMQELEKIKRERADKKAKEDAEASEKQERESTANIPRGNPLLNPIDFAVNRRWNDDVVFKNQAKGAYAEDNRRKGEFVNDLLRSEFHKRFMNKYVR